MPKTVIVEGSPVIKSVFSRGQFDFSSVNIQPEVNHDKQLTNHNRDNLDRNRIYISPTVVHRLGMTLKIFMLTFLAVNLYA